MLKALSSRLTYANVMATIAVFLALGGGAYALSGIPDRSGVYHGCVDPKAGALRIVKSASSCRKTKTVRRGRRRVRIPGEAAITWNQQGRQGLQGAQGLQGLQGPTGLKGEKGDQGTPGPTAGFASVGGGTPPTNPSNGLWDSVAVTAPTSGRLFVSAQVDATTICLDANGCAVDWGVYLDGAPVPGTRRTVTGPPSGSTRKFLVVYGVSGGVSAGSHKLTLQNKNILGNPLPTLTPPPQIGAVLLGG